MSLDPQLLEILVCPEDKGALVYVEEVKMALNKRLIEILVCPICKGSLDYQPLDKELICPRDYLAYPVRDDIPVMLIDEALEVSEDEAKRLLSLASA